MKEPVGGGGGGRTFGAKTEVVAGKNDKESLDNGYAQIPPQELVSSCPDLAIVILNWEYLLNEIRHAIMVLVSLDGKDG